MLGAEPPVPQLVHPGAAVGVVELLVDPVHLVDEQGLVPLGVRRAAGAHEPCSITPSSRATSAMARCWPMTRAVASLRNSFGHRPRRRAGVGFSSMVAVTPPPNLLRRLVSPDQALIGIPENRGSKAFDNVGQLALSTLQTP